MIPIRIGKNLGIAGVAVCILGVLLLAGGRLQSIWGRDQAAVAKDSP